MQKIELYPGIHSSILGFGCAPIKGAVSGRVAKRAIDCAIDCGINHFDLARSYGYGEAENFVGKLIKGKRSNLILASKFGIRSTRAAKFLKPVKPIVRFLRKHRTADGKTNGKRDGSKGLMDQFNSRILLTGKEMRTSLEESLSALKTEYLDYFFVHDPDGYLENFEELKYVAESLKREGKIRAWGLAFMIDKLPLHQEYLNDFDILQFNPAPEEVKNPLILEVIREKKNILFSPLKGSNRNVSPEEKFKELKSQYKSSIILSSMFNEKHIIQNSSIFLD